MKTKEITTAQVDIPADKWFALLSAELKDPAWKMRAMAHIRAKTGVQHMSLVTYHNNGATEEEKRGVYQEIYTAFAKRDPSLLMGESPRGQAAVPEPEVEADPVAVEEPAKRRAVEPVAAGGDDSQQLIELLNRLVRPKVEVPKAELDEGRVTELVNEALDKFQSTIKLPPRAVIEVREPDGGAREIKGYCHRQLPQVVRWLMADVPVWLWGGAGGGKSHLFYQVAEAISRDGGSLLPCDETLTVAKLVGYRNLVNGEFVEGLLTPRFREGGLQGLDEIDVSSPSIACVNSLIANDRYQFPSGDTVMKHKTWRVLAFANSKGTGPVAGYSARNRLDAATLDRFAVIELAYDQDLERTIATGNPPQQSTSEPWVGREWGTYPDLCDQWVDWVRRCRGAAGGSVLISPRASIYGCRAIRAGIPVGEVAEALVFKLVTDDTKARIIQSAGEVPNDR